MSAPLLSLLVPDTKQRKQRFAAALLIYAAILIVGSIPGARAEIGHFATGPVLHSLAYAFLTFLIFTGSNGNAWTRALKAVLIVALMGAGDEFVQSFVPYRGAAVSDWLVDCAASLVTSAVLWALLPKPAPAR
jgi:VanZ family protein